MSEETFNGVASTRGEAHVMFVQGYTHAKALIDNGEQVSIEVGPAYQAIGIRQRKFFHGPVLGQISEQVRIDGERFTADIWKRHLKNLILEREPQYEMIKMPGAKRATPRRVYRSTEDLGPRKYSAFIDEVIAYAASEWGVQFRFLADERDAVRYSPPPKRSTK